MGTFSGVFHVPLGITYFRALGKEGGVSRADPAKGIAYTVAFIAAGMVGPNVVLYEKKSPHAFTRHQLGRHAPAAKH